MDRPAQRRPGATPTLSAVTSGNPVPSLHVVEIVGAVPSDEAPDEACPLTSAADPPWHAIQVLIGLIRNKQAAVLHAHLPNAHRLAGLAGGITRTPVLATVQGQQLDMPDLEVHRLIASQLSVVSEASYFHALGLGLSPERISLDVFDAQADDDAAAESLDAIEQRLRRLATPTESRGAAQARALAQPLAQELVMPIASGAPVAIRAVLDELEPSTVQTATVKG